MLLHTEIRPFLMNNIRQDGVFLAFLDVVFFPVVRQLVSRFLAEHTLLNPFFRPTMFLPQLTGSIQGNFRVGHFLHALIANFGKPHLYGFCFWARN